MTAMARVSVAAKINLALVVGPRRVNGLHEVATVLQRIDLCDRLELEPGQPLMVADRKSTRLNSSHIQKSRMPSSA